MTWQIALVVTLMSVILPVAFMWLVYVRMIRHPPRGRSPRCPRDRPPAQDTVELHRPLPEQLLCRCPDGGRRDRSGGAPRRCGLCGNYR